MTIACPRVSARLTGRPMRAAPGCRRRRGSPPHLLVDDLQVLVHRAGAEVEDVPDLLVGLAVGDPEQHLGLAVGELELLLEKEDPGVRVVGGEPHQEFAVADASDEGEAELRPAGHRQVQAARAVRTARLGKPGPRRVGKGAPAGALDQHRPEKPARLGRRPENVALGVGGEQMAARAVEGGARALRRAGVGEMHPDPGEERVDGDRLGDVVDAARLQALHDVLGFRKPGHEDDRHVRGRTLLQAPAGLEAVDAGHHRVEEDDVGRHLLDELERLLPAERHQHHRAGVVQRVGEKPERLRAVVDDENGVALALRLNGHRREPPAGSGSP